MPVYKQNTKVGEIVDELTDIDKRYHDQLVFQHFLPSGTILHDFNGYPTALTNFYKHVGSVGVSPSQLIQCLNSNSIQLTVPVDKIQNGIEFTFDSQFAQITADKSLFMKVSPYGLKITNPVRATITQLQAGFTYATFHDENRSDSKLKVTLSGDTLVFSNTSQDPADVFFSKGLKVGTACEYDNGSAFSVLVNSIVTY